MIKLNFFVEKFNQSLKQNNQIKTQNNAIT